jgi:hypothetical protein
MRIGVVRDTMKTNPLLAKAPIGRAKQPTVDPDRVYGIASGKNDGGTAAALGKDRAQTPQMNEETKRALEKNHLLTKADVGRPKPAINQGVDTMVHGKKGVKGTTVSDSVHWKDLGPNPYSKQPEVGRARPPMSQTTAEKVHGITAKFKDGGTAEVLGSWNSGEDHTITSSNPLLQKSQVGRPRGVDSAIAAKVHGKKSRDPQLEGGVSGALGDWRRPDTQEHNARNDPVRAYKAELGRARPPLSGPDVSTQVHGMKSKKLDGGTQEALSNWKPNTPSTHTRRQGDAPSNVTFGKPSGKPESLSALMKNTYGEEWLQEQLQKTSINDS